MKRPNLSRFARFISLNKIKMVRGYSYVSAFAIPFLVATQMSSMVPQIPWWVLFLLAILAVWIIGQIDFGFWKFGGLWKYELEYSFIKNPEWVKQMEEVKQKQTGGNPNAV